MLAGNPANSTLTSFTVGSVQRELAAMGSAARPGLASLPAAEFPNVVSLFGPLLTGDAEQKFTDGLQLVIDAIATRMPDGLIRGSTTPDISQTYKFVEEGEVLMQSHNLIKHIFNKGADR